MTYTSNVCLRTRDNYFAIAGKQHLLFRHNDINNLRSRENKYNFCSSTRENEGADMYGQ